MNKLQKKEYKFAVIAISCRPPRVCLLRNSIHVIMTSRCNYLFEHFMDGVLLYKMRKLTLRALSRQAAQLC